MARGINHALLLYLSYLVINAKGEAAYKTIQNSTLKTPASKTSFINDLIEKCQALLPLYQVLSVYHICHHHLFK